MSNKESLINHYHDPATTTTKNRTKPSMPQFIIIIYPRHKPMAEKTIHGPQH